MLVAATLAISAFVMVDAGSSDDPGIPQNQRETTKDILTDGSIFISPTNHRKWKQRFQLKTC